MSFEKYIKHLYDSGEFYSENRTIADLMEMYDNFMKVI